MITCVIPRHCPLHSKFIWLQAIIHKNIKATKNTEERRFNNGPEQKTFHLMVKNIHHYEHTNTHTHVYEQR